MRALLILAVSAASFSLVGCKAATGQAYAVRAERTASIGGDCACGAPQTFALQAVEQTATAEAGACATYGAGAQEGDLVSVAAGPSELGARYEVGAQEHLKAGLMIPAEAVVCVGNFAKCLTNVFFPTPQPALHYVSLQPTRTARLVAVPVAAPRAACAPAPRAACAPAPMAPPPPPPPAKAAGCGACLSCVGPECGIPTETASK